MADLDRPRASDELYLARSDDVETYRPIVTGDVFEGAEVPGAEAEGGLAMVLAHPCSMRRGAHLRSHVQLAPVRAGAPISLERWDGNFGVMPLPELRRSNDFGDRAVFEEACRVPISMLNLERRVACLSTFGILLLLQRMTFHMTRVAIDLDTLQQSIDHVLEEVDLLEEWMRGRLTTTAGEDPAPLIHREEEAFEAVLSRTVDGSTLRGGLRDAKTRAAVRRAVRSAMAH